MRQRDLEIGYQGVPGAFSAMACAAALPQAAARPYHTVETLFQALAHGAIDGAMTAIENRLAGAVPAVLTAWPQQEFYAVREHCQPIRFCAWGNPGSKLNTIRYARSHPVALKQCGKFLRRYDIAPIEHDDTAGAAQELAAAPDPQVIALASPQAGALYGLECLAESVADSKRNHTRFVLLQREAVPAPQGRSIGMALAMPHDAEQFAAALKQQSRAADVPITRCDRQEELWFFDCDAPQPRKLDALYAYLAPLCATWRELGRFAPCRLRARQTAQAGWFRPVIL